MSLSNKTHLEWAELFADLLKKQFQDQLVSIVLYGSVATGREKPDSDIDLLIVIEDVKMGAYRRRSLLDPLYEEWDRQYGQESPPFVSTLIKSRQEAKKLSPIYFDMTDRRKFLFDSNHFMETVLADVKERLDRLGSQRRH